MNCIPVKWILSPKVTVPAVPAKMAKPFPQAALCVPSWVVQFVFVRTLFQVPFPPRPKAMLPGVVLLPSQN